MFTKATLLALLPAVLGAPLAERQAVTGFSVIAARSTSPIHLQSLAANSLSLVIGEPTSTYCPEVDGLDCSAYTNSSTILGCAANDGTATSCSMGTVVPGGQYLYVDPTSGAVKYTQAHSQAMPVGAIRDQFIYQEETGNPSGLGHFTFAQGGLFACPVEGKENVWQVTAGIDGVDTTNCLGFEGVTSPNSENAWQYT